MSPPPLQPGSVVWADAADKNGYIKDRPMVVLAIGPGGINFVCCCVTHTDKSPRPKSYVGVPWDPTGRAATGLKKPSWAVTDWIIHVTSIRRRSGVVTQKKLQEIIDRVPYR
jgi:hypothetical protein